MAGVIYYNIGRKCRARLLVSLSSLRQHYSGPVTVLLEGPQDRWFRDAIRRLGAADRDINASGERALVRKAQLWKYSPYDASLFLDADTIVLADPSALFGEIERHGFVVYHFAGWQTTGNKIGKRIRAWGAVLPPDRIDAALAFGPAVNTGVFGFRRDAEILPAWEILTRRGWAHNCTRRLVDELACQCLLPRYPHKIVGPEWGASVRFGDLGTAKILHFHGSKHCLDFPACAQWKAHYWAYSNRSRHRKRMLIPTGDPRLRRYLEQVQRTDLTVVSAVNGRYWHKLRANLPQWMGMDGLREQRFLIFTNGLTRRQHRWLKGWRNVECVPWDLPGAANDRELMLTAFVLGCAEHVQTPFWMKLDADATPVSATWTWPDYAGKTIIGHRCGYTKTKGQANPPSHFLNQLDAWYEGETGDGPFFQQIPARARYGHKRVASYCWIEATEHTRAVAALCGQRLPIPSHDTLSWYVAYRQGRPVERLNMRKFFRP